MSECFDDAVMCMHVVDMVHGQEWLGKITGQKVVYSPLIAHCWVTRTELINHKDLFHQHGHTPYKHAAMGL